MPKIIKDFQYTINRIPTKIDQDGHKRISKITNVFWGIHFAITITLVWLIVSYDGKINDVGGISLVVLQLMVTKIFDSAGKMYDNAVAIQISTADITEIMLSLIKKYYDLLDVPGNKNPEYERFREGIAILGNQIADDLERYSKNMTTWKIVVNSFFWKSPEHTPLLQKDVIKDKFLRIIAKMTVFHIKHNEDNTQDTSPETQSLRIMAY